MKFKEYLEEQEQENVDPATKKEIEKDKKQMDLDNLPQVTIQEMMDYVTNENWSGDEKKLNEACKYMKEMYKDDNGKKYLKDVDDYTTSLNEVYSKKK